jgi:hypothetical protein
LLGLQPMSLIDRLLYISGSFVMVYT